MKHNQILIATNNQGKFIEIKSLLDSIKIDSKSAISLGVEEPEETGKTFEENSLLKARYYAKSCNMIAIADDSGLCIEALENAPGIHSARFAIDDNGKKNFPLAFEKIFLQLERKNIKKGGIKKYDNLKAYFVCNLSIFNPFNKISASFEGRVDGHLSFPPRGNKGFGYDPIFIKNGMNQTFGEIDANLKDKISHRFIAFEKLKNYLTNNKEIWQDIHNSQI